MEDETNSLEAPGRVKLLISRKKLP